MNTLVKKIIILSFSLFIMSCGQPTQAESNKETQENSKDIKIIDLESNFKVTDEKMKLSDAVCDVEYIKLETTDESVLPSVSRLLITNKHILISAWTFEYIYMFDRKGKFIRKIGKFGEGPGEFSVGICFTADDSIAYIRSNWAGKILKYRLNDNKYTGAVPVNAEFIEKIYYLSDNTISLHKEGGPIKNMLTAIVLNTKGDTISYLSPNIDKEKYEKLSARSKGLPCWQTKEQVNTYELNNDTIYSITKSGIKPRYILNLGKYKMPEKLLYDNKNRFNEEHKYFTIRAFTESNDFLYIYFNYQDKTNSWYAQYNKKTENIKFWKKKSDPNYGSGCYNDIDGGPEVIVRNIKGDYVWFPITPQMVEEYLTPENISKKNVLFPEKKAELIKFTQGLKEDDNPIIALYKLK